MFLLGLVAGSLADRFYKLGVLLVVQILNLIVGCVVLTLLVSGNIEVWHVYLAVFFTGTGWTLDFAARRSYYSELFAPSGLVNAVSLDTASLTGSMMVGPFLGGGLISLVGFSGTYAVMLAMYLVGFVVILSLVKVGINRNSAPKDSIVSQVVDAVRVVRGNRTIWVVFLVTAALNFFGFPYVQMVPVIARDVLGVGEVLFGVLMSSAGLGALCALSRPWAALVLVAGLMAGPSVRRVLAGAEGPDLVDVLARTGRIQMTAGALLALGLALSA